MFQAKTLTLPIFITEDNNNIKHLQQIFFDEFKGEKYNPKNFIFHITLHIDKNEQTIFDLQKTLLENFVPFELEFDKLVLFDYPGDKIEEFCFCK